MVQKTSNRSLVYRFKWQTLLLRLRAMCLNQKQICTIIERKVGRKQWMTSSITESSACHSKDYNAYAQRSPHQDLLKNIPHTLVTYLGWFYKTCPFQIYEGHILCTPSHIYQKKPFYPHLPNTYQASTKDHYTSIIPLYLRAFYCISPIPIYQRLWPISNQPKDHSIWPNLPKIILQTY